jgi:hypothetical protein
MTEINIVLALIKINQFVLEDKNMESKQNSCCNENYAEKLFKITFCFRELR